MDGILDWYLFGVVAGLGVAEGAATPRRGPGSGAALALAGAVLAFVAGLAIVLAALPLWTLAVLLGCAVVGWLSLRRLGREALPAAYLALVALALVPVGGYVAAAAAPIVGQRLGRRAGSRYAGLRVLAKD